MNIFDLCVGVFLDSLGLHRVENVSHTEAAVSLHLYSPPFQTCQTFDQRTGHRNTVKMTFCSKYGERTPFVRDLYGFNSYAFNENVWKCKKEMPSSGLCIVSRRIVSKPKNILYYEPHQYIVFLIISLA